MSKNFVWLTGASSGIGAHLCQDLLEQGYAVVSFARRAAPIEHPDLYSVEVDLTDHEALATTFIDAANRWPSTRIVHNAGTIREKPIAEVTDEDLMALTQLHLGCAIAMLQAALPLMQSESQGRVVLMSTRAIVGLEKRTVYSATKAGMVGMGRTWALELAPHGVTVNMVAPGPIEDTQMLHDVLPKGSEAIQRVTAKIPVGRLGKPQDVSRAVQFFLHDDADFVTGQTLFVCGGTSLGGMSFS